MLEGAPDQVEQLKMYQLEQEAVISRLQADKEVRDEELQSLQTTLRQRTLLLNEPPEEIGNAVKKGVSFKKETTTALTPSDRPKTPNTPTQTRYEKYFPYNPSCIHG
ncbi:hypothetical protein CYMTET_11928 [Cymbomonas tetramitiformis]|uniref:Uncharacterized protein n=1 Tax=Cymbomonas tetramitiformis TaxID=36881 RepID=A0AAE0GLB1_9CHLO|nr:hypothetical protein CYMTET_11928 [Cymbomonas tetramitiformis]